MIREIYFNNKFFDTSDEQCTVYSVTNYLSSPVFSKVIHLAENVQIALHAVQYIQYCICLKK